MADEDEAAALRRADGEDEEAVDYENLDLSFDDIAEEDCLDNGSSNDPSVFEKPWNSHNDLGKQKAGAAAASASPDMLEADYILGTLIVRVVAARNLEPVTQGGGLGKLFFGGGHAGGGSSAAAGGSANPYASVRFGSTTQRTSQVFDTVDPIWPRGEAMYMDVMHPAWEGGSSTAAGALEDNELPEQNHHHHHRGDPPKKKKTAAAVSKAVAKARAEASSSSSKTTTYDANSEDSNNDPLQPQKPVLTVAVFHASEMHKSIYPSKKNNTSVSGDSDDRFLGMTAIDLTQLLTGKVRTFDEWLPLTGGGGAATERAAAGASIRIVCEYEASDAAPAPGDLVRFSGFCHPADLYPAVTGRLYKVEECCNSSNSNDRVLISHTSPEGWVSTFLVHRYMLICEERHQRAMDFYNEELASLTERIVHSPMVNAVQESIHRVPDEGLLAVGADAIEGGTALLTRWLQGGARTAVRDIAFATNWDGRFNPNPAESLSTHSMEDSNNSDEVPAAAAPLSSMESLESDPSTSGEEGEAIVVEPLPNMPACPITGEPMRDPVVAADGHTYERSAIARWLKESDKSPLTGSVLSHKNLVPNYMLLSSLQEVVAPPTTNPKPPPPSPPVSEEADDDDEEQTTEINIDDD